MFPNAWTGLDDLNKHTLPAFGSAIKSRLTENLMYLRLPTEFFLPSIFQAQLLLLERKLPSAKIKNLLCRFNISALGEETGLTELI